MEGWIVFAAVVTAVAGAVAAGSAAVLAWQNRALVKASQEQVRTSQDEVRVSQEQVRIGQEQLRDQQRPVLVPKRNPNFQKEHDNWLMWEMNEQALEFHNVGAGTAFNVAGVLYGCASYLHDGPAGTKRDTSAAGNHWACWLGGPIAPQEQLRTILKLGNGIFLDANKRIGKYSLNAPDEEIPGTTSKPGVLWRIARCTITYHDISGRKYASIFDFVHNRGWHTEAILPDIDRDLYDLEGYSRPSPMDGENQPAARLS